MSSLASNALAMVAARFVPPLFGFALNVSVARLLGAEGFGAYLALLALLAVFQAAAAAGMQFHLTREIAAHPERAPQLLVQARSFALASGAATTVLYVLYVAVVIPPAQRLAGVWLATTLLPSAFIGVQESVFLGLRVHQFVGLVGVIEHVAKLALGLSVLAAGGGLFALSGAIAVARWIGLAAGAFCIRRLDIGETWMVDTAAILPFARAIAPFSVLFALSMAYFRVDVPIMLLLVGPDAAGVYGAASGLFMAVMLLPDAVMAAVYPRIVAAARGSRDTYLQATWLVARLTTMTLAMAALVVMVLAEPSIGIIYGGRYAASVDVLLWLALCLPVFALNGVLGQALQAGGEQRAMLGVVLTGLVTHVILNLVLVAAYGVLGAPLALLGSGLTVAAGALWVVHRRVRRLVITGQVLFIAAAIVVPLLLTLAATASARPYVAMAGLVWLTFGAWGRGFLSSPEWTNAVTALRAGDSRSRL